MFDPFVILDDPIGPHVDRAREAGACAVWVKRLERDSTCTVRQLVLAYPDFIGTLLAWYESNVEEFEVNPQAMIAVAVEQEAQRRDAMSEAWQENRIRKIIGMVTN